jgi:broad specificity phosphatase PhoE
MRKIWIVRHGYREDYINKFYSQEHPDRPSDSPLNNLGYFQAKQLADFLAVECVSKVVIYSSPFLRTMQTANEIATRLNTSFCVEEGLREWIPGSKPLVMTTEERCQQFPRIDKNYRSLYLK